MKVFKKIVVVALAFAMVMGMSVCAFAAGGKKADGMNIEIADNGVQIAHIGVGESITLPYCNHYVFYTDSYVAAWAGDYKTYKNEKIKCIIDGENCGEAYGQDYIGDVYCSNKDMLIVFTFKKGRLEVTTTPAPTAAAPAATTPAKADTAKNAGTAANSDIIQPKTAAEAQVLIDYYTALIKKNKLENTGAVEESLLAYYKALAKTLK